MGRAEEEVRRAFVRRGAGSAARESAREAHRALALPRPLLEESVHPEVLRVVGGVLRDGVEARAEGVVVHARGRWVVEGGKWRVSVR